MRPRSIDSFYRKCRGYGQGKAVFVDSHRTFAHPLPAREVAKGGFDGIPAPSIMRWHQGSARIRALLPDSPDHVQKAAAIINADFTVDIADVMLRGAARYRELLAYLWDRTPVGEQHEHLAFTCR